MTVSEVQEKVSPEELCWWMAYNRISPIGPDRQDYNAALIAQAVYNSNMGKGRRLKLDDVRLKWGEGGKTMIRNMKGMINLLSSVAGLTRKG
jgi:hypothetical protein